MQERGSFTPSNLHTLVEASYVMKSEVYLFSEELDIQQNFFLTKVLQKTRLFESRENQNPFAYMSIIDIRRILGDKLYKTRLSKMVRLGFLEIKVIGQNKYGKPIYNYYPLIRDYKRIKISHKMIQNYYHQKHSKLSKTAKRVFKHISHGVFDLSYVQFEGLLDEIYTYHLSKPLLGSKKHATRSEHKDKMELVFEMIQEYNSCNLLERVNYVNEDEFGNRLHSIFTSVPKQFRKYVKLWGESTTEIDLIQSQPTILAALLYDKIGSNSFTNFINSGNDIYLVFSNDRIKGKNLLYKTLFGKHISRKFKSKFPDVVNIIQELKTTRVESNPSYKSTSNLAYILQQKESKVFRGLWDLLYKSNVSFIPIHDSILVQDSYLDKTLNIMSRYLSNSLKLNINLRYN